MSELRDFLAEEMPSPKCVGTTNLGADNLSLLGSILVCICKRCGEPIPEDKRSDAKYCSRECQHPATKHSSRDNESELRQKLNNIAYAYLNRDRYLSVIDGRYEGPLNKCVTLVMTIRKDHGYHPMPIDVHVNPIEKKFGQVTPDDHDWAERQKPFQHTQPMPRLLKTFCTHCVDLVIDGASAEVRATRGVYLPIEHECARVRVYDLRGKLLEVKSL